MPDPADYAVNADDGEQDTTKGNWTSWGSYDPLNEQKGFGSGAGTNVVTDPSGVVAATPGLNLQDVGNWFKNVLSGQGGIADYGTLLAGVMGLQEYMNRDRAPKTWQGTLTKGTYVPPTVSPDYYSGIMSRGYGERAMGVNPFTGGRYIAPTAADVYRNAQGATPGFDFSKLPGATEGPPAPTPAPTAAPVVTPTGSFARAPLESAIKTAAIAADQGQAWAPEALSNIRTLANREKISPAAFADLVNSSIGSNFTAEQAAAWLAAGKAAGGVIGLAVGGMPRYLRGETDGMADKIPSSIDGQQPAKLSHGEFVIPADVVSHLGNGNSDAGAKMLYKMMDRVRQARTGTKRQGKQIQPEKFMPGGIATLPRYAGGGAVAFADGGTTTASTTAGGLAPWVGDYIAGPQGFLSKAWALGDQPYQAYQGPLTAGTSPLQQQYYQGLSSMGFPSGLGASFSGGIGSLGGNYEGGVRPNPMITGAYFGPVGPDGALELPGYKEALANLGGARPDPTMTTGAYFGPGDYVGGVRPAPYIDSIAPPTHVDPSSIPTATDSTKPTRGWADLTGQAPTPTQPVGGIAQQYMNPYLSAALQPQLDEIRRQADISRSRLGAKFGGAGGGASAFGGARQGIESSELERSMLGEMGKTLSSGYMTAYDKAREQFNTEQQQKRAQAEMLAGAGREQQSTEQAAIDAQIKQFQEAQMWPYKQLEFQRSLLQGLPVGTQTLTPQTSGFNELIAGIGQLLGTYKDLSKLGK